MQTRQGREGKDSGAHGELAEQTSGLGDGLVTTKQRRRSRAAGDGEDGVGGDAGRPAGHGLVERKRGSRRSLWAQRRGEAVAVATATLVGGGGSVRVRGRESRGEDGDERVSGGFQEGCVASLEGSGRKQEVARGSRRWPRQRRRPSATRAAYWRGEDDRRGAPGGLGRLLQQAAQVGAR